MSKPNDALKPSDEARRVADWMRDLVSNEQVGGVRMTLHSAKEVSAALDALVTALEATPQNAGEAKPVAQWRYVRDGVPSAWHDGSPSYRHPKAQFEVETRTLYTSPPAATDAAPPHTDLVAENAVKRLQAAVEGECEGLAIDEKQARAILDYVAGIEDAALIVEADGWLSQPEKDMICDRIRDLPKARAALTNGGKNAGD